MINRDDNYPIYVEIKNSIKFAAALGDAANLRLQLTLVWPLRQV